MKYIRKFNESVIEPGGFGVKEFIDDIFRFVNGRMPFESTREIFERHNIELVNYDTFYQELPDDQKSTAPTKGHNPPIFGLVNPLTNRPRIVYQVPFIDPGLCGYIKHILEHESIHIDQISRRSGWIKYSLPDPKDQKSYFSDKDEVMAFSQSISDMIMNGPHRPESMEEAIKMLNRNPLYMDIKRNVDSKILNRYKKYIYFYLKNNF